MFAFRPSNNNGSGGGKPCDGDGGRIGLSERKKIALASEANSERGRERQRSHRSGTAQVERKTGMHKIME